MTLDPFSRTFQYSKQQTAKKNPFFGNFNPTTSVHDSLRVSRMEGANSLRRLTLPTKGGAKQDLVTLAKFNQVELNMLKESLPRRRSTQPKQNNFMTDIPEDKMKEIMKQGRPQAKKQVRKPKN